MAILRPIHNHVFFQFEQEKTRYKGIGQFQEKTDWGFEFADTDTGLETGRWVKVTHVGNEVPDDIKPGMRVCVEKLKWTNEFKFGDESYWRTDSECILSVDESVEPA